MRDEFLFNCEQKIMEANLCLMCGLKEIGLKKMKEVSDDLMQEIGNSIHPFTTNTQPYVIAALRVLANKLEEKTDGKWENTIKGIEKNNEHNRCNTKRRRGVKMQEKLLKTLMSSMEMRKAGNSILSTLMMEQASVEAARDINDFVTPCCDITAPVTVGALRYVADIIEKELLNVDQAVIAKKVQDALHDSTTVEAYKYKEKMKK